MKLLYKVHLGFLLAKRRNIREKIDEFSNKLTGLKQFRFYVGIHPTEFEHKKQELEKKLNFLTFKERYLSAKIRKIKWKLI